MQIHNVDEDEELEKMYVPTDIIGAFRYVLNKERNISSTRAIKIQAGLTIQIEKHSKTPMKQDQYKMLPYLYVFPTKEEETQKHIDYLNGYVSQILEHIFGDSSAKLICICGISLYIYRLSKTGSQIKIRKIYNTKN
jgi:hypothetical protein